MENVQGKSPGEALSQTEVVVLAVFLLGGEEHAIDTEDIAIKVHELAPGRFAWRKYPKQINLELVRVNLSDAKKRQRGSLIEGSGRTGWVLTAAGQRWARKMAGNFGGEDLSRPRQDSQSGSIDETRWRRERSRILLTSAWSRWANGDREIPLRELEEVFRIDSYAVGQLRQGKITRLLALFGDDDDLEPFIRHSAAILEVGGEERDLTE